MNARQLCLSIALVFAASCGGGGGDTAAVAAPSSATSETILAFDVDGNAPDNSQGAVVDAGVSGGNFTMTWQLQSITEPHRVRVYYSRDDILGDFTGSASDKPFFDAVCDGTGCGGSNPYSASCHYSGGSTGVLSCTGGGAGETIDRFILPPAQIYFIVRVCRLDTFDCDAWPRPVYLAN